MSEDELQRKMGFIINQQAQFATDIQVLRESQSRLTDAVVSVVGMIGSLTETQKQFVATQERLAQEVAEGQKQTDAKFAELAVKQAETDERLNIFINVVERYINERRNGPKRGGETDASTPSE